MIFDRLFNRVIACLHAHSVTEKVAARYRLLRGDLNSYGILTPADTAISLQIAAGGGFASCNAATLNAADISVATITSPAVTRS